MLKVLFIPHMESCRSGAIQLGEATASPPIGPLSIGVATSGDENQIFRQKEAVALASNVEAPLLASVWECDGVCVSVVFGIPVLCQFGFILLLLHIWLSTLINRVLCVF